MGGCVILVIACIAIGYWMTKRYTFDPTNKAAFYEPSDHDVYLIYDSTDASQTKYKDDVLAKYRLMSQEWEKTQTSSLIAPDLLEDSAQQLKAGVAFGTDKKSAAHVLKEDDCSNVEQEYIDHNRYGYGFENYDYGVEAPRNAYHAFKNAGVKLIDDIRRKQPRIYV